MVLLMRIIIIVYFRVENDEVQKVSCPNTSYYTGKELNESR